VFDQELADKLQKMVGFRNSIVPHYQRVNMQIVRTVITSGLDNLVAFDDRFLGHFGSAAKSKNRM
jgi:uncharacterized protein YutE (UPF0331/DUF86 family)